IWIFLPSSFFHFGGDCMGVANFTGLELGGISTFRRGRMGNMFKVRRDMNICMWNLGNNMTSFLCSRLEHFLCFAFFTFYYMRIDLIKNKPPNNKAKYIG